MTRAVEYFVWRRTAGSRATVCVRHGNRVWTYGEFAERTEACAAQLAASGVRRGTVVALRSPNRPEFLVALMSLWRLGAVAVPLDPVADARRTAERLATADADLMVDAHPLIGPVCQMGAVPCVSMDVLAARPPRTWTPPAEPALDDRALLSFTGTDGRDDDRPAVAFTHRDLQDTADAVRRYLELTAADHCSLSLPLHRPEVIAANFLAAMLAGARLSLTHGGTEPAAGRGDTGHRPCLRETRAPQLVPHICDTDRTGYAERAHRTIPRPVEGAR